VVHVGGTGATNGLIAEIDRALTAHERFSPQEQRDDMTLIVARCRNC
jgi:RNA-binding protein YhbY